MARLVMNPAAITQMANDPVGPVQRRLSHLAHRTRDRARQLVGRDSGRLAGSIEVRLERDNQGSHWLVGSTLPYTALHHQGSRPHVIRARNVPSLHFFWEQFGNQETLVPRAGLPGGRPILHGGVLIIGKGFVDHPGTSPNPFLVRAMTEAIRGG